MPSLSGKPAEVYADLSLRQRITYIFQQGMKQKRTAPAGAVRFIMYHYCGAGVATTKLPWYKLVLYLTVPLYTVLRFYSVVVRFPSTLSMESPLPDFTGIQVAFCWELSFLSFHPHLPFGYIIEQNLNFCNIPDVIFTIYQAMSTEPLNCSVTNFLTSSD